MKSCVVLSSYNGIKHIDDQLKSLLNQTKSIDCVYISDDCSNDGTDLLIEKFITNNRITNWYLKTNEKNVGWKLNFVNLIKEVPKDIDVIFLCDQDDIWYKDKMEEMIKIFNSNPDIGLLVSNVDVKYEDENAKKIHFKKLGNRTFGNVKIVPNNLNTLRPGCVMAINRKMVQDCINNYHVDELPHDMIIWMYFFCKRNIYYLNKSLIQWRRFSTSTTLFEKKEDRYNYKIKQCKEMLLALNQCKKINNIDSEIKNILDNYIKLENTRLEFFKTKKISTWFSCLKYIDFYSSKYRMWIGDLYFTLKNR